MSRHWPLCAAVLGALLIWAAPAAATHVACGDVITEDTTLDSDLVDCPGDGVVIGASGVTLDLAGHTIDGSDASGSVGVNNRGEHDGLTVMNGTISNFGGSVRLREQQGGDVSRLVTDRSIDLTDSSDIRIERNVVGGGIGLLTDSDRVLIARNEVAGSVILQGFPPSMFGGGFPDDVIIDRNTIRPWMALFQAPNATVTRNRVLGSPFPDGAGIFIRGSQGSALVDRNEVSGATIGISLYFTRATVTRNLVSENATDGIWAATNAFAVIDRNRSERNGDDGIDVDVIPSLPPLFGTQPPTLSRNFASFNGDLGIEAVPEVIDGGRNKARGNGNPLQCVGVTCKQ